MDSLDAIQESVDFIEDNILEDLKPEVIASHAYMSSFLFQRLFSALFGLTLGDYIRNRRLTMAAQEVKSTRIKIIDIAYKYGYESPESFSRAFTRFHGVSPMKVHTQKVDTNELTRLSVHSIIGGREAVQGLMKRGYSVKENGPVYYTKNMDKTAKWFEEVLGWYVNIDSRNADGLGMYGCALPVPEELLSMQITAFNGKHLFYGESSQQMVVFMRVEGIEKLHSLVKHSGWTDISDIIEQPWGGKECQVKTIDGSMMKFFQLD